MLGAYQLSFWPRRRYTDRMEMRLDRERRERLAAIARARGVPRAQVLRELIDQAYEAGQGADPTQPQPADRYRL